MQSLINFINQYSALSNGAIAQLEKSAVFSKFPKGSKLLDLEERCNKLWFIKSGMVRKYHLHKGKEITIWIHCENELVTSLSGYFHRTASNEIIVAEEETETISISRAGSEELGAFPQFTTFTKNLLEKQFACIDIASRELSLMDARGKYEYLREIAPEMLKRAKLGHIASIMGITQETLSRIRNKT